MKESYLKRYSKATIVLHWVHSLVFLVLFVTGISMFMPGVNSHSASSHCGAGIVFVVILLIYIMYNPKASLSYLGSLLKWERDDMKWIRHAPDYYFGGSGHNMPPQGYMNTGQKLWQLLLIVTGLVLIVTGAIMWLFRSNVDIVVYQYILIIHNIAFIMVFPGFLIHLYMGVVHPRYKGAIRSMIDGKILRLNAQRQYPKWYDEIDDRLHTELEDQ